MLVQRVPAGQRENQAQHVSCTGKSSALLDSTELWEKRRGRDRAKENYKEN